MSTESTEQVTSTPETSATTAPKKKMSKPKAKRPNAKKAAKKTAKKKGAKKKGTKKERESFVNEGKMLNMHARILKVLAGAKDSLTVAEVAKKGYLTEGITAQYIGQLDEKARKRFEQLYLHYPTLLTIGWVKMVPGKPRKSEKTGEFTEALGPAEFQISASGRKAINGAEGQEVLKKLAKKDKESGRKAA